MSDETTTNAAENDSHDSETNNSDAAGQCAPRNALFCCPAPVCMNKPELVDGHSNAAMNSQSGNNLSANLPDLLTSVQQKIIDNSMAAQKNSADKMQPSKSTSSSALASSSSSVASASPKSTTGDSMSQSSVDTNKSNSVQDISSGDKTPETPLTNVVLRKVEKEFFKIPKSLRNYKLVYHLKN